MRLLTLLQSDAGGSPKSPCGETFYVDRTCDSPAGSAELAQPERWSLRANVIPFHLSVHFSLFRCVKGRRFR